MKQEDKGLLLKDLCARLPYGVKCEVAPNDTRTLVGITFETNGEVWLNFGLFNSLYEVYQPIPYLRPMSSMTDEENYEFRLLPLRHYESYDWLNSHHFDWRDLITKGLALEAPSDMYIFE